ncbi:MAG: Glutamine synthetase [Clostridia bacterium 41_269]|nr:MAG: Glutamine synthetase [Clostridia bacterium 41_269]
MNAEEKGKILQAADDRDVRFIRLQFTDILGTLKNVAVTVNQLEKALDGKIVIDGSSVNKYCLKTEKNLFLFPDPSTFVTFPWRPQEGAVARLICSLYDENGEPAKCCTRSVLQRILGEAQERGYSIHIGPEAEFFLFLVDEHGKPTTETHDKGEHFDLTPLDLGENARRDMIITLQDMGIDVETSHHEKSPGQHEIVFKPSDALSAADNIVTYKFVIRTIAQRHGLHATFMPKPIKGLSGSGMHLRFYLFKNNKKLFIQEAGLEGESNNDMAYFMGGIFKHARSLTALANPTINSYKRLWGDNDTPRCMSWSYYSNKSFIKIPLKNLGESFIEWRSPDPSCNPYLTIAAAVRAGIRGIEERINPPKPNENIDDSCSEFYNFNDEFQLPKNLEQALITLMSDKYLKSGLGEHLVESYFKIKIQEWNSYSKEVHPWEIENYLHKF